MNEINKTLYIPLYGKAKVSKMGIKLIFAPRTVHSVIDSDKMHAKIGKQHIGIKTDLQIISPKTGHILDDNALDFSRLYIG